MQTLTSKQLFEKLCEVGYQIAKEEGLPLKSIGRAPGARNVGLCDSSGNIKIKIWGNKLLFPHVWFEENGRTLAHELAHLKYMHHRAEFWKYAAYLCKKVEEKLGTRVKPEIYEGD